MIILILGVFQDHKFSLMVLVTFSSLANATLDVSQIKVRDFKNYREIHYRGSEFFLNKKNSAIRFVNRKGRLFVKNPHSKYFVYASVGKTKNHYVYFKSNPTNKNMIGYVARQKSIFKKKIECSYRSMSLALQSDPVLDAVDNLNIENLLDVKSCSSVDKGQIQSLNKTLAQVLEIKSSKLSKCFDSKSVQDFLDKDEYLRDSAGEVFSRYLKLVNSISSGQNSLAIGCFPTAEAGGALATFSEKENPPRVSLATKENKFAMDMNDAGSVLEHELFHAGLQQIPLGKDVESKDYNKCLDENFVRLFEKICNATENNFRNNELESSKLLFSKCLEDLNWRVENDYRVIAFDSNRDIQNQGTEILTTISQQQQGMRQEAAAVTAELQKQPITFNQIQEADIKVLSENLPTTSGRSLASVASDGEFHTIPADPKIVASLDRVTSSLSETTDNVQTALSGALQSVNRAAGVTVGKAQASSTPVVNNPLTLTEITGETYASDSVQPVIQKLNSAYPNATYEQKEAFYASGGKVLPGSTNLAAATAQNAVSQAKRSIASVPSAGSVSAVAATPTQKSKVGDTAAAASEADSGSRVAAKAASAKAVSTRSPSRSIASIAAPGPVVEIENEDPASAVPVVEQSARATRSLASIPTNSVPTENNYRRDLDSFRNLSVVKGSEYSRIRRQFLDPSFQSELSSKGIVVYNTKGERLWKTTSTVSVCFQDNGQSLAKVSCKN